MPGVKLLQSPSPRNWSHMPSTDGPSSTARSRALGYAPRLRLLGVPRSRRSISPPGAAVSSRPPADDA